MFRLIRTLSVIGVAFLISGCTPQIAPTPLFKPNCQTVRASNVATYTSEEWSKGEDRVVGLGTYTCNFDGQVDVKFGETMSNQLLFGASRIYSGAELQDIGLVSPEQERVLMENSNPTVRFMKEVPFQIVVTLTPKATIRKLDTSIEPLVLNFVDNKINSTTTQDIYLGLKVGK